MFSPETLRDFPQEWRILRGGGNSCQSHKGGVGSGQGVQIREAGPPASVSISSFSRLTNAAGSSSCPPSASVAWSNRMWLQSAKRASSVSSFRRLHDRVRRVDLEDRLRCRHLLPGGLQHALEVRAHAVLVADQARRRIGQPVRDAHARWRDPSSAVCMRSSSGLCSPAGLSLLLLRRLAAQLAQIEIALGDRLQRLAVELGERRHDPLVDAVVHQQHFDAELAEDLEVRAVAAPPRSRRR